MKKVTSLLILVFAVVMLLVACGGNGDTSTTTPAATTTAATTTAATTTAATTTAATTTAATTTAATTTAATTTAATTTAATTTAATTTAATTTAATTTAATTTPVVVVSPLDNKIYADIDFKADGSIVDVKEKLTLDKGTATIGETDVAHNGTTINLPTLQANGKNVGKATFKDFTDAATAIAFWNDADGFSFEAFFVAKGATTAIEGVFCATENPGARSGVGIAMAVGGKPYLCLGLSDNTYLSITSANAVSTTEYVHVITTTIVENGTTKGVVYVNGVKVAEGSKGATIHVTDINKTIFIGGDTNKTAGNVDFPNDDFSVADIKVYGTALTADEVKAAYDFATAAFNTTAN